MKFLRRFLAPVLLSSWLFQVALVFLATGRLDFGFSAVDELAGNIGFMALFVAAGMLTIGYPTGYFLGGRGVSFWLALPLLVVAGAMGGAAIGFLMSLPGMALRASSAHLIFSMIGALAGAMTGCIWTAFNADLFRRAPRHAND
jgi:hypothetical protein